jgi:hypothetical protein
MGIMAAVMLTAMVPSPVLGQQIGLLAGLGYTPASHAGSPALLATALDPTIYPTMLLGVDVVNRVKRVIENAMHYIYKIFRAFSFYWILFFGLLLGMAVAFGQAAEEEIRNYFLGVMVVLGAHLLAGLMLYFFGAKPSIDMVKGTDPLDKTDTRQLRITNPNLIDGDMKYSEELPYQKPIPVQGN